MKLSNKKIQELKEQRYKEQIVFMAMLGTAMALRDTEYLKNVQLRYSMI